jgi:hypothetical protein
MKDLFSEHRENNWLEFDPDGLREKLELLEKKRTPVETERMYSSDKKSKEALRKWNNSKT